MNRIRKLLNQILFDFYVRQLRRNQWRSQEYLKKEQNKKLKAIVKYAYDYVPFYHRLFRSVNVKPQDIKSQDDLVKIPPVSKQDIKENYQDFIARGLDTSKLPSSYTSGSTGIPLRIYYDHSTLSFHSATRPYIFTECGVKPNDKFVTIWGRAQSIIAGKPYDKLLIGFNEIIVPAFLETAKLVNVLNQINPNVICTFPSILLLLANTDTVRFRPRLIFTQGETVTQHCRDIVKKTFGLELFETYGSVEFEILAFECNEHRGGLHIITDGSFLEFVDENMAHVSPEEEGEIIVTDLHNRAMPLIRYRIGDTGVPTDEKCSCGRSWPLLKNVSGKINDYIVLPSGRKISYINFCIHLYKVLERNIFSISQYQIIQDKRDRIVLKIVKGKRFNPKIVEDVKINLETFFAAHNENLEVIVEFVDEIPRVSTGKRRWLISML